MEIEIEIENSGTSSPSVFASLTSFERGGIKEIPGSEVFYEPFIRLRLTPLRIA